MKALTIFSYDQKIKVVDQFGQLLFFKPSRKVEKAINIPYFYFNASSPIYKQLIIETSQNALNSWLKGFKLTLDNFDLFPIKMSNIETNKACMYRSRKTVYFNPKFYNKLNAVGKAVIYYHELGHQHFDTEFNADLFACLLAAYNGYSVYMIQQAFKETLSTNGLNDDRLENTFKKLLNIQENGNY